MRLCSAQHFLWRNSLATAPLYFSRLHKRHFDCSKRLWFFVRSILVCAQASRKENGVCLLKEISRGKKRIIWWFCCLIIRLIWRFSSLRSTRVKDIMLIFSKYLTFIGLQACKWVFLLFFVITVRPVSNDNGSMLDFARFHAVMWWRRACYHLLA